MLSNATASLSLQPCSGYAKTCISVIQFIIHIFPLNLTILRHLLNHSSAKRKKKIYLQSHPRGQFFNLTCKFRKATCTKIQVVNLITLTTVTWANFNRNQQEKKYTGSTKFHTSRNNRIKYQRTVTTQNVHVFHFRSRFCAQRRPFLPI